jgi:hypothetical protein
MHLTTGAIITHRTSRHIIAEHYLLTHREPVQHQFSNGEQHARAAAALVRKLAKEWKANNPARTGMELINSPFCGKWVAGDMPKGAGYAFNYYEATNRTSGIEPRGFVQNCETDEF